MPVQESPLIGSLQCGRLQGATSKFCYFARPLDPDETVVDTGDLSSGSQGKFFLFVSSWLGILVFLVALVDAPEDD
ncbi:hypothetical protein BC936DRAFT_145321 [Jimgerdemannia flammicorona]|uniref:Uncharacterized protein n=1 Tax=Jimgerdemannia flammicorona TaxID=994334 RepID=A0A433DA98_9FUNG|nr:hypothetical protein BC936DRAFT_145321 [Jimgerdemannia flammicorona]